MKRQISFIKNKSKRIISLGVCLGVLGITFGIGASAGTYSTVSNGRIAYDADEDGTNEVLFDASDISNMSLAVNSLQDNISTLTTNYAELIEATETGKNSIVTALNGAALTSLAEGSSYAEIVEAIEYLQNVPEGATLATADNISSGYAAIVPGTGWIVGNGADNDTYYSNGYTDGLSKSTSNSEYTINYTYHTHTGNSSEVGGCYGYTAWSETISITANDCRWDPGSNGEGQYNYWGYCPVCGTIYLGWTKNDNGLTTQHTHMRYGIGLTCGKDETTIESVEIIFN